MRALFHPFLPNGPCGDPLLWVDMPDEGQAVMLDLGELREVPARKLLRVARVVVTHAHMDHFIGFDALLRLALGRERELVLSGPAGFLERVAGRIAGYAWNLIERYPVRVVAEEVDGDRMRSAVWSGAGGMRRESGGERLFDGTLHAHRAYTLHVASFDHGIPVLGVRLDETERLAVDADRLARDGLRPGAWLRELKQAVRRCAPGDTPVDVETLDGTTRRERVDRLAEALLSRTAGQRLGYLTDLAPTVENIESAVQFIGGVDLLVCETPFLHADAKLAAERRHLTARVAGELARAAGVRRLAPFHVSPRYAGREEELFAEAAAAFGGRVETLPGGTGS